MVPAAPDRDPPAAGRVLHPARAALDAPHGPGAVLDEFSVEPDAAWLERYLDEAEAYEEIRVMLFSHGVESLGLAPIERWRGIVARAPAGGFVGVDERRFPRDFAAFVRYHNDLTRLRPRYPLPGPLQLAELDRFLEERGSRFRVE